MRWAVPVDLLTRVYAISQAGQVVTTTDSSTLEDSVDLLVEATVRHTPRGGAAGLVRSARIRSPGGALQDLPGQTFPFAFSAPPFSAGVAPGVVAQPPVTDPCTSVASVALSSVQDLLFGVPDSLYAGQTWTDSTEYTLCRAGVRLTVSTLRTFRFRGLVDRAGSAVLAIDRTSQAVLTAAASRAEDTTRVIGSGNGSVSFLVDAATGALLSGEGTSHLQISIRTATHIQRAQQNSTIRIRQLEDR